MTLSLHVWTLSPDFVALSAHVVLEDQALSRTCTAPVELGLEAGFEAGCLRIFGGDGEVTGRIRRGRMCAATR